MAKEIFMPKLSSTMQVGTLLQWFKEEGETVEVGEPLFEIMTDKINIEVEAYEEGTLIKRYFGEDEEIPVNQVIGYIGASDETVPEQSPGLADQEDEIKEEVKTEETVSSISEDKEKLARVRATPAARRIAKEDGITIEDVEGSGPNGRIHAKDVEAYTESAILTKATPLAKKVAAAEGVDLTTVKGTGVNGKILRSDLEGNKGTSSPDTHTPKRKRVKLQGVRKVVAERMAASAFTAPHVTLNSEIDMTEVINLRKQLLPVIEMQTGYRLSYTEVIVKAVSAALKKHPNMNASLEGDELVYNDYINIGLAVAIENGLVVPVIKNADQQGLASLTNTCKSLGKAARDNKLKPTDMTGGTFTISNLGMYAIDTFSPIINQPEIAILGIGRINEKPVGINGAIELRPMMSVSLSFDHRAVDGAPAAAFLTDLKKILENPYELLV